MNPYDKERRYSYVFLKDDNNNEIILVTSKHQKEVQQNIQKSKIDEVEQNSKQQLENKENLIHGLKLMEKKTKQIQENQFKCFYGLFQQSDKYFGTLEKQFVKTKLSNLLSKEDNEVALEIQKIKEIDNKIHEIYKMIYSKKNVPITINIYDRVKNVLEKKYQDIKNLNSLILQKKESVTKILHTLRLSEKAIKSQQDKQKIEQDIRHFVLVNENVEKYLIKLNFHFNDENLLKQIQELKNIKKIYEDQNIELNKTIAKLEQELKNEKAYAQILITQLKQELQNEKDQAQEQAKKQKEELENEKAQALQQITQLQQKLQEKNNKSLVQEQKLHEKDQTQTFIQESQQQPQNQKNHNFNEQVLKQLDQVEIQLMQNDTLLSINEEEQYSWIDFQLPEIKFYENLYSDGFTIIKLLINSKLSDSQSYFGLCEQNIDNSEITSINFNLAYLPEGVFFFISMQGDLLIKDPTIKTKLKIGGFENISHVLFTFDSPNNLLTIIKNFTESESFQLRLPKNNKKVIPFILQAYGEDLTLKIQ